MGTFTIYCHGTGRNRVKEKIGGKGEEIVATFGNRADGKELKNYLILDGVGWDTFSEVNLPEEDDVFTNPSPATFNPNTKDKLQKNVFSGKVTAVQGNIMGRGTTDNLTYAINCLRGWQGSGSYEKSEADLPGDRINMLGWSRGAALCIRLANRIYQLQGAKTKVKNANGITAVYPFPTVKEINIFAVDPVAGGLIAHYEPGVRKLSPLVKNFVGILSLSDNRGASFRPQDLCRLETGDAGKVLFLPFPGVHSDVASRSPRVPETGDLVFSLAYHFLKGWGTKFAGTPAAKLDSMGSLEKYSALVANRTGKYSNDKLKHGFVKAFFQGLGVPVTRYHLNHNLEKYTQGSHYFINEHHRVLFKETFPTMYEVFFGKASTLNKAGWVADENKMKAYPLTQSTMELLRTNSDSAYSKSVNFADAAKLRDMKLIR
jgi:hypothetical protein